VRVGSDGILGGVHRETSISPEGVVAETWHEWPGGPLHREDGPAAIYKRPDGSRVERWHRHGKLHRLDGPAYVETLPSGARTEQYFHDGQLHREDGFACVVLYADGSRAETSFFRAGHPADRPPGS
jgi:hypothetical protein